MKGKKRVGVAAVALTLLLALSFPAQALEATQLVPVGSTVGIELDSKGVTVVDFCAVKTADGEITPAEAGGLQKGDVIVKINDHETATAEAFLTAVKDLSGETIDVTAERGGKQLLFHIQPALSENGSWQLGDWLRENVRGIGTVTFYDPDSGTFGALGHGINDLYTGALLPFEGGRITEANVVDVIPGECGKPGELCGQFDKDESLGELKSNTLCGIFGQGDFSSFGKPVPLASETEVKLGPATFLANVNGDQVEEFSIEISRLYRGNNDNRFLLLTVTDPKLIARTGGIVQGMSGSPILQDGKLVGAVTHVLVSDSTRGYGISIEDMLAAAG